MSELKNVKKDRELGKLFQFYIIQSFGVNSINAQ